MEDWNKYAQEKAEQQRQEKERHAQQAEDSRQRHERERDAAHEAMARVLPVFERFKTAMQGLLEVNLNVERGTPLSGGQTGKSRISTIKMSLSCRSPAGGLRYGRIELAHSMGESIQTKVAGDGTETSRAMEVSKLTDVQVEAWMKQVADSMFKSR